MAHQPSVVSLRALFCGLLLGAQLLHAAEAQAHKKKPRNSPWRQTAQSHQVLSGVLCHENSNPGGDAPLEPLPIDSYVAQRRQVNGTFVFDWSQSGKRGNTTMYFAPIKAWCANEDADACVPLLHLGKDSCHYDARDVYWVPGPSITSAPRHVAPTEGANNWRICVKVCHIDAGGPADVPCSFDDEAPAEAPAQDVPADAAAELLESDA